MNRMVGTLHGPCRQQYPHVAVHMGKNTNKPVHKSQLNGGGGGGGGDFEEKERAFHSKEYEQAQLNALMSCPLAARMCSRMS